MNKFILIDHSIQKYGGHNLEYAIHVLRAAEKMGYKPVLAVSIAFQMVDAGDDLEGIQIIPAYYYDFWGNRAGSKSKIKKVLKLRLKNRIRFRWRFLRTYSWFGILLSVNNYNEYIQRGSLNFFSLLAKSALALPLLYFLGIARGAKQTWRAIKELFRDGYIHQIWRWSKRCIVAFRPIVRSIFAPVIFFNRHKYDIYTRYKKNRQIKAFAKDTYRLFRKISLQEGDIVFIPTLSEYDMLGLLGYMKKHKASKQASWHLLFRRNIFEGREPSYNMQFERLSLLRKKFLKFSIESGDHRVKFYTDTDKLTAQYNYLRTVKFVTLPIPINEELQTESVRIPPRTLRAVYIGDARREKGYQFLPRLARGVYRDFLEKGRLELIAQSNFSFDKDVYRYNADVVLAKKQLQYFYKGVTIIDHPLSTSEYKNLVLSSDIGILMYDRNNYYARSSGAFVEYLGIGVPVIVTSGSWMADQLANFIYAYHQELVKRPDISVVQRVEHYDWWHVSEGYLLPSNGTLTMGGHQQPLYCHVERDPQANHVLLSFRFATPGLQGVYVTVQLTEWDLEGYKIRTQRQTIGKSEQHPSSCLFRLTDGCDSISLSFHNAFDNSLIGLKDIVLEYLAPSSCEIPLSSVGLIVDDVEDAIEAIGEIVNYYPHYLQTAQAVRKQWNEWNNAQTLVSQIILHSSR
jgi:hypothetical protein